MPAGCQRRHSTSARTSGRRRAKLSDSRISSPQYSTRQGVQRIDQRLVKLCGELLCLEILLSGITNSDRRLQDSKSITPNHPECAEPYGQYPITTSLISVCAARTKKRKTPNNLPNEDAIYLSFLPTPATNYPMNPEFSNMRPPRPSPPPST